MTRYLDTSGGDPTTRAEFQRLLQRLRDTGIPREWDALLRQPTGRPALIPPTALAFALARVGSRQHHRMHLVQAAKSLNALTWRQRAELGIDDRRWEPRLTYKRLDNTFNRLEKALNRSADPAERLYHPAGWRDMNDIVDASIEPWLGAIRTIALDGTDVESWGVFHFGNVDTAPLDGEAPELDVPGASQRGKGRKPSKSILVAVDEEGRNIWTRDDGARVGWRSAKGSRPAGKFNGYDANLVAAARHSTATDPASSVLGGPVPNVVLGFAISPAGTGNRARGTLPVLANLKQKRPEVERLVTDRGFSGLSADNFLLPLRRLGIEGVFDLDPKHRGRRPFRRPELLIDGGLYSRHLPAELQKQIPIPHKGQDLIERAANEELFNERALYRLARFAAWKDDSAARFECPVHHGYMVTSTNPRPTRSRGKKQPPFRAVPGRCCDQATISVWSDELPRWQRWPVGTTAWHTAYVHGRNAIEAVNSSLQNQFSSLDHGHVRVFGLTKVALLLTFTIFGFNVWRQRAFLRRQEELKREPKRRALRRPAIGRQRPRASKLNRATPNAPPPI